MPSWEACEQDIASNHFPEAPWYINIYADKNMLEEAGKVEYKTPFVILSQHLDTEGYDQAGGSLKVAFNDDDERMYYINVRNVMRVPYGEVDDTVLAAKGGTLIIV